MSLDEIESERAARKEALAKQRNEQRAVDVARLNELEIEHGDESVTAVKIGRYLPGIATLAVVRCLKSSELKRYRDRVKGENADNARAAEEAGMSALLYPEKGSDLWKATLDAIPGIPARLGTAAVFLAAGVEQAEGKV